MKIRQIDNCDILAVQFHFNNKIHSVSRVQVLDLSHVGISGNEKADMAAKSALSLSVSPP